MNNRSLAQIGIFLIVLLSSLAGLASAQAASPNSFAYEQINLTAPSTVAVAYTTNGPAILTIIPENQYAAYVNSTPINPLYNKSVTGQSILLFNLSQGSYYALLLFSSSNSNGSIGTMAVPKGQGRLIHISSNYSYPITLTNYSLVNMSVIATYPINIAFPEENTTTTNSTALIWLDSDYNYGGYTLNFSPLSPTDLFFYVNITPELADPLNYSLNNFTFPSPIGVASYGLYNSSGRLAPYQIKTDEIDGRANITALYAYDKSPLQNDSKNGASLQLNVVMDLVKGNATYAYWLQNVMDLNSSNRTYAILNNVWNDSAPMANVTSSTIRGEGNFSAVNNSFGSFILSQEIYVGGTNLTSYSYPLYFDPIIKVNYSNGYPVAWFGYYNSGGIQYYDNITFLVPNATAQLVVTPFRQTPSGNFYDSEFVFGGEANGETTNISSINASLSMYYNSNGQLTQFPSLYTFGSDTSEAARGIRTIEQNGVARVVEGKPNYNVIIDYAQQSATNSTIVPISTACAYGYVCNIPSEGCAVKGKVYNCIAEPPGSLPTTTSIVPSSTVETTSMEGPQNSVGSNLPWREVGDSIAVLIIILAAIGIYRARTAGKRAPPAGQSGS